MPFSFKEVKEPQFSFVAPNEQPQTVPLWDLVETLQKTIAAVRRQQEELASTSTPEADVDDWAVVKEAVADVVSSIALGKDYKANGTPSFTLTVEQALAFQAAVYEAVAGVDSLKKLQRAGASFSPLASSPTK